MIPVGSLPDGGSPYGVKDMAGDAREWVSDWYDADYYKDAPPPNPQGPTKQDVVRSIHGGPGTDRPPILRPPRADGADSFSRSHGTGFRCARSLETESQKK